jgi:hypothetical protein
MTSTAQLEREAEQTRTQLAESLEELRSSLTPGQILDQFTDYVGDGAAGAFARNLRDQAVNNPMALVMMGASVAWLAFGGRGGARRGTVDARAAADRMQDVARQAREAAREGASEARSRLNETSNSIKETAADASERASQWATDAGAGAKSALGRSTQTAAGARDRFREMANSAAGSMTSTAAEAYDSMAAGARDTASKISEKTRTMGQRTIAGGNSLVQFCRDQPVLVAGIGLVIGATIGALLPRTDVEDRAMGESSDALKEQATEAAMDTASKTAKVADHALDAAQDEARRQGLAAKALERVGEEADPTSIVPPDQGDGEVGTELRSQRDHVAHHG